MIIQLTNAGVSLLNETKRPLNIKNFVLGSSYNYTPSLASTGILGTQVYAGQVTDYVTVNANVVKYQIALDYTVGDFSFGEFALYVNEQCVAVGVDSSLIQKTKFVSKEIGNAVVVDIYLQMSDDNYTIWADSVKPGNHISAAVVQSVDYLPAISQSGPNLYIVAPVNVNQADTLAYTSNTGLWAFDNYQYENVHDFTVTQCAANTVTIDTYGIDPEKLQVLNPAYVGQTIFEFISGENISICRTVASFVIGNNHSVFSFNVPLATLAKLNDRIRVFSRQKLSITDTVIPVATTSSLGGIIVGDGLNVSYDGLLSVDFPVTSVNGQYGDVELTIDDIEGVADVAISNDYNDLDNKPNPYTLPVATSTVLGGVKVPSSGDLTVSSSGTLSLSFSPVKSVNNVKPDTQGNVTLKFDDNISGLIVPMRLPQQSNLNNYAASGLYYGSAEEANSWQNGPEFLFNENVTLEVVPIGTGFEQADAVQRITTSGHIFTRIRSNNSWYAWYHFYALDNFPIAAPDALGIMSPGNGLTVENGVVSANVYSVNGQTGDVDLSNLDWKSILQYMFNQFGGIPQLSEDEADPGSDQYDEQQIMYGRIGWRQLTFGGMYLAGFWNAELNEATDTSELADDLKGLPQYLKLVDGGKVTWLLPNSDPNDELSYLTFNAKGWVFEVTSSGSSLIDDENQWNVGDFVISNGQKWIRILGQRSVLHSPANQKTGFVVYRQEDQLSFIQNLASPTATIAIDQSLTVTGSNTNDITLDLASSGVTAGDYYHVTVDTYGRVIAADNNIDGGTF